MRLVQSYSQGFGQGALGVMPIPIDFPKGQVCSRIRMKCVFSLTSTDAAPYTLTLADVTGLFGQIWGSTEIKFGDSNYEVIDDSLPFARLREMGIAMSERDAVIQIAGQVPVQLNAYTTAGPSHITVPATSTLNGIIFEMIRHFVYERSNQDIHEWCPGTTQMKTMRLQTISGAVPNIDTNKVLVSGTLQFTILFDTTEAEYDRWCRPIRIYRNTTSGLQQEGPAGGGGLLGLWEYTAVGVSTALTVFELKRDSDTDLHNTINASDVVRGQQSLLPVGTFDLNGLVTCLYFPDDAISHNEIPTSTRWLFVQPNNDLTPPQTVWLFTPPTDENYVNGHVAPSAKRLGSVHMVNHVTLGGTGSANPRPSTSSISSLALLTPNDPNYDLSPGVRIAPGQSPVVVIPPVVTKAAGATAAAHTGDAQSAALASLTTAISGKIPGFTSAGRGQVTNGQNNVAGHVVGGAAGTQAGAANASNLLSQLTKYRTRLFGY